MRVGANTANDAQVPYCNMYPPMDRCETIGFTVSLSSSLSHLGWLLTSVWQRASFAHDLEPAPYRPTRKYARVESSASSVTGTEGAFVDAGLAFGRSFRVGWGPGGTLVHLGALCSPRSAS